MDMDMDMEMDIDIDMTHAWVNTYLIYIHIYIHTYTYNNTIVHYHYYQYHYQYYHYHYQVLLRVYTEYKHPPHLTWRRYCLLTYNPFIEYQTKKKRELIGIRRDLLEGRGVEKGEGEGKERSEQTPDVNGDEGNVKGGGASPGPGIEKKASVQLKVGGKLA